MDRVSRPLIGLLVATVAFFALWVTMLKPSNSTSGGASGSAANPGLGQLNNAISAAHNAVATSNAASAAHGGTLPPASRNASVRATRSVKGTPAVKATPAATATPARAAVNAAAATHLHVRTPHHRVIHHVRPPQTPAARLRLVSRAIEHRQVLAMLFYNPAGADDRLVRQELGTISAHRGSVVKLAIPISELASYSIVTQQVPVTGSPTLVVIDRGRGASELVGFASQFEITQRIDDALAVR